MKLRRLNVMVDFAPAPPPPPSKNKNIPKKKERKTNEKKFSARLLRSDGAINSPLDCSRFRNYNERIS